MRKLGTIKESVQAKNTFSAGEADAVPYAPRTCKEQPFREVLKTSLDGFRSDTNWNFVHLTVDARIAPFLYVIELKRESFCQDMTRTLPCSIMLTLPNQDLYQAG